MLIVGSLAAKANGIDLGRPCGDVDIITSFDRMMEFVDQAPAGSRHDWLKRGKWALHTPERIYEFELTDDFESARWLHALYNKRGQTFTVAPTEALLALKLSHRYKKNSPHFYKTMRDIHTLRARGLYGVAPVLQPWFKQRELETYDYSHPDLTVDKGDFFKKTEDFYVYDHDDIHLTVSEHVHKPVPVYNHYLADGESVKCDIMKWTKLPFHMKLRAGMEESMVLALERVYVPGGMTLDFDEDKWFKFALQKVCTSITSGWFREFCWQAHDQILLMYHTTEWSYTKRFDNALEAGKIADFNRQETAA